MVVIDGKLFVAIIDQWFMIDGSDWSYLCFMIDHWFMVHGSDWW